MSRNTAMSVEGMISRAECDLLYDLAAEARGTIVEIGGWRGRSAVALAMGSLAGYHVPVYTIDPHVERYMVAPQSQHQFENADRAHWMQNILQTGAIEVCWLVNMPSGVVGEAWEQPLSLLFIDGDHNPSAVMLDWTLWSPWVVPGGVVALHDAPEEGVKAVVKLALESGEWAQETLVDYTVVLRRKS